MKRVLSIIGTRPEAIKMAPVILELQARPGIQSLVCSTGQHREMLDQALETFGIRADESLGVMTAGQSLSEITARILSRLDGVLSSHKPDYILAQGDTTTVMTAALAAFYHQLPFGHVEAGLRTGNLHDPFPEEFNRIMADRAATHLFAPTERAVQTLLDEGLPREQIFLTGNTVVDAAKHALTLPSQTHDALTDLPEDADVVLITCHRRESFGSTIRGICRALGHLAKDFPTTQFIFPVHLNPQVQAPVNQLLQGIPNLHLLPPLDYLTLLQLMKRAQIILTDSGGIQEEAPATGTPVIVMRETTERPEGVDAGCAILAGTDPQTIRTTASRLLRDPAARAAMKTATNPYGDGQAAKRIVDTILKDAATDVAA